MFNESFNNDVFEQAQDAMVDLMDDGFTLSNKMEHNSPHPSGNPYILLTKDMYFHWEDVEECITKFVQIYDKVVGIDVKYDIEITNIIWDNDTMQLNAEEILNGGVYNRIKKTIISSYNEKPNTDITDINTSIFNIDEIKIYY